MCRPCASVRMAQSRSEHTTPNTDGGNALACKRRCRRGRNIGLLVCIPLSFRTDPLHRPKIRQYRLCLRLAIAAQSCFCQRQRASTNCRCQWVLPSLSIGRYCLRYPENVVLPRDKPECARSGASQFSGLATATWAINSSTPTSYHTTLPTIRPIVIVLSGAA